MSATTEPFDIRGTNSVTWRLEQIVSRSILLLGALFVLSLTSCQTHQRHSAVLSGDTVVELRVVKGRVTRVGSSQNGGTPYARERLAAGAVLRFDNDALGFLRQDSGATLLLSGPATLTILAIGVSLDSGRLFVDTQGGPSLMLKTALGSLEIAEGRSSIQISPSGEVEVYVLRGTARQDALRARSGERMLLVKGKPGVIERATVWDDWTGGLATADPEAEPAPYGIGTVGARKPGDTGNPRFPLTIQRLDVKVTLDHDFATTEVDETFLNPSADTVEGIYTFRTPPSAILSRFGVDRDGLFVWGRVKEKREAKAQYESHVYAGSTEDPALLEWISRGVYQARLYPIEAGISRRLVTKYSEWLGRQGTLGERRLYVYPMAANAAAGTLPSIEELTVHIDWSRAGATRIRVPQGTVRKGKELVYKARDILPKADFSLELYDSGPKEVVAYRTKHKLRSDEMEKDSTPGFADEVSKQEADYLTIPLPERTDDKLEPGIDLSIVVDSSAATEPSSFAVARHLVAALLSSLGPRDRAALFTGDTLLLPVLPDSASLKVMDATRRKEYLAALANAPLGGATDLGALLASAAEHLDSNRRGSVIYIGDGRPSVGEMLSKPLRERLERLPPTMRVLAAGVGTNVNFPLLEGLVRGGPLERVSNGYEAALAALRLLEAASRGSWQGVTAKANGIDRMLPRQVPAVTAGEPVLLVGRVAGDTGGSLQLGFGGQTKTLPLRIVSLDDAGDARRRWGEARFSELGEQQAGRLAQVDLARRYGLVTYLTSLYVATRAEAESEGARVVTVVAPDPNEETAKIARWKPWRALGSGRAKESEMAAPAAAQSPLQRHAESPRSESHNKAPSRGELIGTRAKGEEGAGEKAEAAPASPAVVEAKPNLPVGALDQASEVGSQSTGAKAPAGASVRLGRQQLLDEAQDFGITQLRSAPPPQPGGSGGANRKRASASAPGGAEMRQQGDPLASGEAEPLSAIGTAGGFGSGHGRLAGNHPPPSATVKLEPIHVTGRFAPEVAQRILRQNYVQFQQCYEQGLGRNPNLQGSVTLRLVLSDQGAVARVGSTSVQLPDAAVVVCLEQIAKSLTFPQPESGTVTLFAPFVFQPGSGGSGATPVPPMEPTAQPDLGLLSHTPSPCSTASNLPLNERRKLWYERLAQAGDAASVLRVYQNAVELCEAATFFDRQILLYAMVDRLPTIAERVVLYRLLLNRKAAARVVYQAILTRIEGAEQLKLFHVALGIVEPDESLVRRVIERATKAGDRIKRLRELLRQWPNDVGLQLRLLDALEDSGALELARTEARKLRRRSDLTAHLATLVGEFYLRASEQGSDAERQRDAAEARRCFGEIVEFAPEDPAARRILGDLLVSHGFFEEASRQYQTLKLLVPDDVAVDLRLGRAAFGLGKVEEAWRWTEKAKATSSPDGQSEIEQAARVWSSCYLAWALLDAQVAKNQTDIERLLVRANRLDHNSGEPGSHAILTWTHPELELSLFVRTATGELPAKNLPRLNAAEARLLEGESLEIRLDPEQAPLLARLGAEATLTVVLNEDGPSPVVLKKRLRFGNVAHPVASLRLTISGGELREEVVQ